MKGVLRVAEALLGQSAKDRRKLIFFLTDFHAGELKNDDVDGIRQWIRGQREIYPQFEVYGILIGDHRSEYTMYKSLNTTNGTCIARRREDWDAKSTFIEGINLF